ncbi:MAG: hypothetical protein EPN49_11905 [Rhodanobacter sp.]|nr:MAG: hypothetical protein EPN49_11905 [Rhodanobacter sp.]
MADSVEKLVPEKLSPTDPPKLAATVAFRKLERTNLSEIELSRASLSEISTSLSKVGVFQQNRPNVALAKPMTPSHPRSPKAHASQPSNTITRACAKPRRATPHPASATFV